MSPQTRRLTAVAPDGQVHTRTTHRPYACVVVYHDPGRRPTWHGNRAAAEKAAKHVGDTVVLVQEVEA